MKKNKKVFVDTEYTSVPICPYCGEEDADWWDYRDLNNDGDSAVHTCGKCGNKFRVDMSLDPSFTTEKIAEEMKGEK